MIANMRKHLVALRVHVVVLLSFNQYTTLAHRVDCPLPDVSVLEALMVQSLTPFVESVPTIRINNVTYVCLQSGMFKDTYRGMSFLAEYECTGSPNCPSERSQFVFSCTSQGTWSTSIEGISGSEDFSFIPNPVADFTTPLRTDCSICICPGLLKEISSPAVSDEATHCVGMYQQLSHSPVDLLCEKINSEC